VLFRSLARDLSSKENRLQSLIESLNQKLSESENRVQNSIDAAESRVTKKIPKRVDLTDIRNEIQALKDSLPNFATLITMEPEAIRDALELLDGEDRLDASAIKNLDQYATKQVTGGGWGVVRRLSNLDDVNVQTTRPNENATIQYQTASGKWFTGVSITVSDTPPSDPKVGDLWIATV
jgi:DNA repair exonuclease SbcCD ATPase subunit